MLFRWSFTLSFEILISLRILRSPGLASSEISVSETMQRLISFSRVASGTISSKYSSSRS